MSVLLLLIVIGMLAVAGFVIARARAVAMAAGDIRQLHSLPGYYGWHGFIMVAVPALLFLTV